MTFFREYITIKVDSYCFVFIATGKYWIMSNLAVIRVWIFLIKNNDDACRLKIRQTSGLSLTFFKWWKLISFLENISKLNDIFWKYLK